MEGRKVRRVAVYLAGVEIIVDFFGVRGGDVICRAPDCVACGFEVCELSVLVT